MIFAEESSRPEDRRCLRFKCSSFYELNAVNTLAVHDLSAVNDYILRFKYSSTDANTDAIDRMLNLNVNVVMKNVHDVLPHMIERGTGDIVVTSSLAAHFPTPWEPVYASSKWAINCFVQTVRRQVFKHGIRVGSISPGPVISALLADWPEEKLKEAKEAGSLLEASEVANVVMFMLTRPRGMTIRDVVMLPTNFDL